MPRTWPIDGPCRSRAVGLYSGGTLCYEALLRLRELLDGPLFSNLELDGVESIDVQADSLGHTLLDLGDDSFTVGRPHPMVDLWQRCHRLVIEASDPEVGVLLLDVMLGHGAHPDPASVPAAALREARRCALDEGRGLACVVALCGTPDDPQDLEKQRAELASAGAVVVSSNFQAATIAAALSKGDLSLAPRS